MTAEGDSKEASIPEILCKRCNGNPAALQIRSEQVCPTCFRNYVTTKAIKRMETYRIRGHSKAPKKLLLPLSFGPSSASLVHILDQHLQGQYNRMNRTSYELFVVHVDTYLEESDRNATLERLGKYKARYPRHVYSRYVLEEALRLDNVEWESLGIRKSEVTGSNESDIEKLQKIISTMSSATSRADITSTLLTRLIVDIANRSGCEGILFGDSTTRLAEKTLTETAKGRGYSLPWQVSDGMSHYGIELNYPLRDLLKKEIIAFTSLSTPSLEDIVILQSPKSTLSASSKMTTIDDLMVQYFESVEENYPSIVANVVRTSSKLEPLSESTAVPCGICGLPVEDGTDGIFGWGGDQNSTAREPGQDKIFCYGCSRSMHG